MKAYDIIEFKSDYKYVVLATSYGNPIDELENIEDELKVKEYSGKVLFDLLLCNGMNSNRFVEIKFDGERFDLSSSIIVKNPNNSIKKGTHQYLKDKPALLENSVLPKAQRYIIIET